MINDPDDYSLQDGMFAKLYNMQAISLDHLPVCQQKVNHMDNGIAHFNDALAKYKTAYDLTLTNIQKQKERDENLGRFATKHTRSISADNIQKMEAKLLAYTRTIFKKCFEDCKHSLVPQFWQHVLINSEHQTKDGPKLRTIMNCAEMLQTYFDTQKQAIEKANNTESPAVEILEDKPHSAPVWPYAIAGTLLVGGALVASSGTASIMALQPEISIPLIIAGTSMIMLGLLLIAGTLLVEQLKVSQCSFFKPKPEPVEQEMTEIQSKQLNA